MKVTGYIRKTPKSPYWQLRYKVEGERSYRQKSLGVRTKEAAEKAKTQTLTQLEHELCGLTPSKELREVAQASIEMMLDRFAADLHASDRDDKYIENSCRFVRIVSASQQWKRVQDIDAEGFIDWRTANSTLSPKTLNHYLTTLKTFLNWLVKQDLLIRNPLNRLSTVRETRKTRERRALTRDEARRLIASAPRIRAIVYLVALFTGLRRGELKAVRVRDVVLDAPKPHIMTRAATSKNRKSEAVFLHPEVVSALRGSIPADAKPTDRVFQVPPRLRNYKKDLEKASIPFENEEGRRVDFHALRTTFNTWLKQAGVPTSIVMLAMRVTEERLTNTVYNDQSAHETAGSIQALPGLFDSGSHIDSHKSGSEGLELAHGGTERTLPEEAEPPEKQGKCPAQAQCDTSGHEEKIGSGSWVRTNDRPELGPRTMLLSGIFTHQFLNKRQDQISDCKVPALRLAFGV